MWKWPLLLLFLVYLFFPVGNIRADSSVGVVITASGLVGGLPGFPQNFTVTYINDHEVEISWVKPAGIAQTMIRRGAGHAPGAVDEGFLVYYDVGNSFTDTYLSMSSDIPFFYSAWSQAADGSWSALPAVDYVEGRGMIFIGLVVLMLGLTYLATKVDNILWRVAPGLGWFAFGIMVFTNSFNLSVPVLVGYLFIAMAFGVFVLQINAEVKHEKKGYSFTTWGQRPKESKPSAYVLHREAMRERLRRVR